MREHTIKKLSQDGLGVKRSLQLCIKYFCYFQETSLYKPSVKYRHIEENL